jgi:alkylation response protein AidB-like acyl-CoA dehydrogenase
MDYLTQERPLLQQSARDFAMEEVLPIANKLYPERGEIPAGIRNKLAELGYFGIMIPEEYGGLGLGAFEFCLVTEELAHAWMSVDTIIRNGLVSAPVESRTRAAIGVVSRRDGRVIGIIAIPLVQP